MHSPHNLSSVEKCVIKLSYLAQPLSILYASAMLTSSAFLPTPYGVRDHTLILVHTPLCMLIRCANGTVLFLSTSLHTHTHTHTHKHNNGNTITLSIMMIHRNTNVGISERFLCTSVKQLKRQLILFSISVPCFRIHCGFPLDLCLQSSLNAYSFSQLHSSSSTRRFTRKSIWEFGNSRIMNHWVGLCPKPRCWSWFGGCPRV